MIGAVEIALRLYILSWMSNFEIVFFLHSWGQPARTKLHFAIWICSFLQLPLHGRISVLLTTNNQCKNRETGWSNIDEKQDVQIIEDNEITIEMHVW